MTSQRTSRCVLLLWALMFSGCGNESSTDGIERQNAGDGRKPKDAGSPSANQGTGSAPSGSEPAGSAATGSAASSAPPTGSEHLPLPDPRLDAGAEPEPGSSQQPIDPAPTHSSEPAQVSPESSVNPQSSAPPVSSEMTVCDGACLPECGCDPCSEVPQCGLDCLPPIDDDGCLLTCECVPPLPMDEVCGACEEGTRCIQYPRPADGELIYECAAWTPCESARACACFDPAFGQCELMSGDTSNVCLCSGLTPGPAEGECACDADQLCIHQAGGPGPGGYGCVKQDPYPCAEDDICGCLDAQGVCQWDAATELCRCDNGLD